MFLDILQCMFMLMFFLVLVYMCVCSIMPVHTHDEDDEYIPDVDAIHVSMYDNLDEFTCEGCGCMGYCTPGCPEA